MKRRIIVILSLILCFMLSCDEKTLDKVFIQGGMDASSPKVVVAVDPDRVEAFERGDVTSIKKEAEATSLKTYEEKETSVSDEASNNVVDTLMEIENLPSYSVSDIKAYIDTLFSNEKAEVLGSVEKVKEEVLLSLGEVESTLYERIDELESELISSNETSTSSLEEEKSEIESIKDLFDSTVDGTEKEIAALYSYIDSELSSLIEKAKNEIVEKVEEKNQALSVDTSSAASYEENDMKAYVDSIIGEEKESIVSYINSLVEEKSSKLISKLESKLRSILNEGTNDNGKNVNVYLTLPNYIEEETIEVEVEEVVEEPTLVNGLLFKKTESGYEVVGYEEGITSLVIPSAIDGVPVTSIADKAFRDSEISGDVVLPKTIESIGDEAFMNSVYLDGKIYLPSSLKTIGTRAFYNCNKIEGDLIIPDSVESIGDEAFALCLKLGKSVYGGKGLMTVGQDVFLTSGIRKSHLPPAISKKLGF